MRSLVQRGALALATIAGLLGTRPATANAQKALVYCPVAVDATGCNAIVTALTGPAYPLGIDRGYDGTNGTVDLKAVDLFSYSVFVVPSLADDSTSQPYALLRDAEVAEHLKAALIGRLAMWSGSPDQGAANRAMKDALIQNLAGWAAGAYATAKGPGLVALLDASASATARYDWVRAITPVPVTSDPNLLIYSSVRSLDPRATTILTSGSGMIGYTNMATFGFQVPNGAAGVSLDAVGQTGSSQGGQVVLLTMEAGNASGATVKTDKDDYAPGETVVISGTGWEAGETVKLTLHMDPLRDSDTELSATADASGNFTNTDFAPGTYDVGVRFVLTALGTTSGRRAQTTFTDGPTDFGVSISPVTAASGGSQSYLLRVWNASTNGSNGLGSANVTVPLGWTVTTPLATPTGAPIARTWTASLVSGVIQLRATANSQRLDRTNGSNAADTIKLVFTATAPNVAVATPYTWSTIAQTSNTLSDPATANWAQTSSDAVVTVSPATVATTTTASGATATYGDASVNLSATVTPTAGTVNTGTVTFTVKQGATTIGSATTSGTVTGGNASVTYALPAGTAAGPYTIEAVYNAGTGFTGSSGTATLTINPRLITVTADAKAKVYGNADPALTFQITSGSLAAGDGFTGSLVRAAGENVGSYAIQKGTLALSTNYTLTYIGASLTIAPRAVTVTADPQTKVYGDADPALTYQITSGSLAFADAFSGALTRAPGNNVGTYAILQGTLAVSSNYSLTYIGANLTITGRPITVTADAKSKVYGDADPSLTYQITSGTLAAGDAITGALVRVAGENVGTYAIQQGTLTAGTNYSLTYIGANLSITTRAITVTADAQSKVYGNTDPTLSYQVTSGSLVSGDAFSGALTRAPGETVGSYAIQQGTLTAGGNYAITFVAANLTIGARPITVAADPQTKVYGHADPALTYQVTVGSLAFSDAFTGALSRAAGETVGSYAIGQGTLALTANYNLTFVGANLSITARPVTVTADPKSKTYGDSDPTLTYQITSGSLAFSDAFSGALTRVAGENVGAYAIQQGTLALTSNYDLTYVGANLSITTRAITVTADPQTKVYGNADPTFTYQVTSGSLVNGDSFSGSLSRSPGEGVGTYAITQGTLSAGTNYALTFVGANLTITARPVTVTADAKMKTYGNADPALTYQITSGSLAFTDVFSGSLARVAGENVGTYAINQGTLALSANYALTFVGANFTITQRPVTVTADAKTKTYGDADPALTYQITSGSLAFSDAFTGALTRVAGENVGPYAIQQGTLALTPNYALTYIGANLTINARPITVTADAKTKVYGDADPALTYQITSGSLAFSDAFSGALTRAAGNDVGTYPIQQGTLALTSNYALTYVGANFAITPRPIAVTADDKSKVYGNGDPTLTYQVTSGSLVEESDITGTLTRAAGENVGTYAIQQGTLTAGTNYTLTFVPGLLTITPRSITITADPKSKVYGDADPALTYQITAGSLAFSDAFSGTLARLAGEDIGTYAINQGTLALSANYSLTYNGALLTITKRAVTITADAKSKTYGNADPALTYQITSGSLAFSDAFTGALVRATGENVGTYAINQGTVALSANYMLTFVPGVFSITQRAITITADAKTKTYGDADPALTYQLTSGTLVSGDGFTGNLTRAIGENVGAYAIQQGTVTAGANYNLAFVGANLSITKRPLAVTAADAAKIAGAANPLLTGSIVGAVTADNMTASYSTTATTISPPNTYPIVPSIDANGAIGNYTVTLNNGTLTVTANAKPVLGAFSGPLLPVALGASINVSIPFTDVDVAASQPYTATIDWGNGTTTTSSYASPGTISGNKTYPAVGVYTVKVTVQQDNFPSTHYDAKTFEYYVVVYDPNGGFVTGGGWIDSPAGACKRAPCTPLTVGKANFGFVSKYKKGQSAPDGNTEFQFKAGDINFHSEVYEWLVVAGAKAQFKGTGTINGSGNYGFMLTAIDGQISGGGGVDKFRIKVWDKNNGDAVVYDNQVIGDPSDTAIPTTALGGGSINIQTK